MKIFITGIAGFIGFHLAKRLRSQEVFVAGCDTLSPYYSVSLKTARKSMLENLGISVTGLDITNLDAMETHFRENKYDILIHLAAQPGVRYSVQNPSTYIQTNWIGFFHILEICKKYPTMRLIYASSSSVYGKNAKIPFSETDMTDSPTNIYAVTKKSGELLAHAYHHLYNIPVTGLRFFTVYGPWGRPDMAYYSFTESILQGKTIPLYSFGKMERDFTYVDDIITGILQVINRLPGNAEILNLGNQNPQSIQRMIEILESLLKKSAVIQHMPAPLEDVFITYADGTHSADTIAFKPSTTLEEGLSHFVPWYLSYREKNASGSANIRSDAITE